MWPALSSRGLLDGSRGHAGQCWVARCWEGARVHRAAAGGGRLSQPRCLPWSSGRGVSGVWHRGAWGWAGPLQGLASSLPPVPALVMAALGRQGGEPGVALREEGAPTGRSVPGPERTGQCQEVGGVLSSLLH